MIDFPCTQCGECCRQLGNVLANSSIFPTVTQDLLKHFPYKPNPDGSCSKLTSDGLCSVYDNRPIVCNIKLMSQVLHQNTSQFYQNQAHNCNKLINNANLDPKYLVEISEVE